MTTKTTAASGPAAAGFWFKPRHIHQARIGTAITARKPIARRTVAVDIETDPAIVGAIDQQRRGEGGSKLYDGYLTEAHEMTRGFLPIDCGALLPGTPGHHPLEEKIARACVAAFHRGKASGR